MIRPRPRLSHPPDEHHWTFSFFGSEFVFFSSRPAAPPPHRPRRPRRYAAVVAQQANHYRAARALASTFVGVVRVSVCGFFISPFLAFSSRSPPYRIPIGVYFISTFVVITAVRRDGKRNVRRRSVITARRYSCCQSARVVALQRNLLPIRDPRCYVISFPIEPSFVRPSNLFLRPLEMRRSPSLLPRPPPLPSHIWQGPSM